MMSYTTPTTHQKQHPLSELLVPRILLNTTGRVEGKWGKNAV